MPKAEKYSKIERAHRILEYLRHNSDKDHFNTQASLRKNPKISPYLGDKEMYNDTIVKLAECAVHMLWSIGRYNTATE